MFVESGAEVHVPEKHSYRKEAMEKQEQVARKGKHLWMILICNLFLTITVILFQPLEHLLADFRSSAEPVWRIWWIQLLLSVGMLPARYAPHPVSAAVRLC